MVCLALDYGEKRIGVAKSDELGMFAHPVGFIDNRNDNYVFGEIQTYCDEFQVNKIIVGLPKKMDGEIGIAAQKVLDFVEELGKRLRVEVITWDERLSTKGAATFLKEFGLSSKKRKLKIDQMAAQVILQGYLDSLPPK